MVGTELPKLPPVILTVADELVNNWKVENLPLHHHENNQELWARQIDLDELLSVELSPESTTLEVERDPNTAEIIDFREVEIPESGANATNSTSLTREPVAPSETVRGSTSYIPFWPASFPDPLKEITTNENVDILNEELLTIAPGLNRGIIFDANNEIISLDYKDSLDELSNKNVVDLLEVVQSRYFDDLSDTVPESSIKNNEEKDETLKETPVIELESTASANKVKGTEWAILLNTLRPITDFNERLTENAYTFPFELDTFQKLALLHLEKHDHVFVAAHTSAGKTVVAEYAIALSQKHLTRTIYTSPIKALSNQKYRDFKKNFKDVGLITGDFQINQTATCLIMTTEILRSMLYCGSDITRDLEYVIFDEVHYVNDRERGHVWEQVLILLPPHVTVVLLSATVPNTIEFADWLGRTHKRKVYVITTQQRPVPLRHYLYTGMGGGSRDNRFLILDSHQWIMGGYRKAQDTLQKPDQKGPANRPIVNLTPKQEKTLWIGLVDHLKRHKLLPVVAFTFSRVKCDLNADNLKSLDLTTEKEKSQIHMFFEKCIRCLKEEDREIPQIIRMREILHKGIGVHHSGMLPIIKEIVEMLFQIGLIKLLFATETFAMGVNMPAKTVVFDSVVKHDGQETRSLKAAEYIQMAGRAGRRGLDDEGTVIILCKYKLPSEYELKAMMLGEPNVLRSQFRLTYGMVLSLLRVEHLSVEGMMSRSFREADHQKKLVGLQNELETVENKLNEFYSQELSNYLRPLVKFYESANAYLKAREDILKNVYLSPKLCKVLVPGRVLIITHKNHVNKLGFLLSVVKGKIPLFKVLVLSDSTANTNDEKEDLWYKMLSLTNNKLFVPANLEHQVLTINHLDIMEIVDKIVQIDSNCILNEWEKRKIERFKFDPLETVCSKAIQELHKLTMKENENSQSEYIKCLHFIKDIKINEEQFFQQLNEMYKLKERINEYLPNTKIPNFEEQFSSVFAKSFLEDKKERLKFLLSHNSLSLYPDYENRIELLRKLNYIDEQNRVKLKGRVACEMGMNELLITELVLSNILTGLTPAEVAGLLSALVLPSKKYEVQDEEQITKLPEGLPVAVREMKRIHHELGQLERSLFITTDEIQNDLNFSLTDVVYQWASGKSFAEIMELTDIQEGIIVRCIQQLNETICDVRNAARIIGHPDLQRKMDAASISIKRDIVFAASLYTNDVV